MKPPPAELFETLFGYTGPRRWVGFYYQCGCLFVSAGEGVQAGNWQAWLTWHWSLEPDVISRYCFGYDDHSAKDMLVLDTKSRTLYAGKMRTAAEVLRQQAPLSQVPAGAETSREYLEKLKDDFNIRLLTMAPDEYRRHRDDLKSGLEKLENWIRERDGGSSDWSTL
ncbi:hypothetical protein LPW11_15590 [Geomonas sp. RF6]|uniref:hypothetical protein n=1 Tax=Geomonas sp. RF6 TaxID=2897342 RepID=UPI001E60F7E4|nr:hypothetical protein [Geomonas sp. RF6]UFS69310.1 hypothetical protein LPW11_15590 [Geomonas sp. RF6]